MVSRCFVRYHLDHDNGLGVVEVSVEMIILWLICSLSPPVDHHNTAKGMKISMDAENNLGWDLLLCVGRCGGSVVAIDHQKTLKEEGPKPGYYCLVTMRPQAQESTLRMVG